MAGKGKDKALTPRLFLTKSELESSNLEGLPKKQQQDILRIKDNITLTSENTLEFGTGAIKNLSRFSNELLQTVKVKDTPEVEGLITDLMAGLSTVDATTLLKAQSSFVKRLFRVDEVKAFVTRYESVAQVIARVTSKLEESEFQLKMDIEICDQYLEQNMSYIGELDKYILAGRIKVAESREELAAEEQTLDQADRLAVHEFSMRCGEVDRLERKLHDFMLMREIAVQNVPQIMLIKAGDSVLIEKLQTSINSAIPLWESQMFIAIQLLRQRGALALQKTVTDTTNKLLVKNSELLKVGSVEIARELERSVVDIEVLKKTSENLIETLRGIRSVQEEGKTKRLRAVSEIAALQMRLNETLLLESKM